MGMHLMKDSKTLHDPAVQINEFSLGELIDIDSCSHAFPSQILALPINGAKGHPAPVS